MTLNIYLWLEDFDDTSLPDYEREEQLREAVIEYNEKFGANYLPSVVQRYFRIKRWSHDE